MNRSFNYTGRVKLERSTIAVRVIEDESGLSRFSADLSGLSEYQLPTTARVIVEPHCRQSSMRFDFGTIGQLVVPTDTAMTDIDRGEAVQFRVKVVDAGDKPGRILALADQVRPRDQEEDTDRKAILPIESRDLGEEIWKIQVGSDESPVLVLNSRVPQLRARLDEDPLLRGAIFPIAIRETLRVLLTEEVREEDPWVKDWHEFAEHLLGEPWPEATPDEPGVGDVIDRAVEAFCARERWATNAQPAITILESDYE